jgi:hypothetical protein
MSLDKLFTPLQVGAVTLNNRIAMAPLTRLRNTEPGDVPTDLSVQYYTQRASAGLIIAEGTHISRTAKGYAGAPGIYSEEQVAAWGKVNASVHAAGGKTALQLWHTGRISHRSLQPDGEAPVAPSAIRAEAIPMCASRMAAWPACPAMSRAHWKSPSWKTFWKTTAAPPTTPAAPVSTWWKSTVPTAICWTSSCRRKPMCAPMPTAAAWKTAPASCWKWWMPW